MTSPARSGAFVLDNRATAAGFGAVVALAFALPAAGPGGRPPAGVRRADPPATIVAGAPASGFRLGDAPGGPATGDPARVASTRATGRRGTTTPARGSGPAPARGTPGGPGGPGGPGAGGDGAPPAGDPPGETGSGHGTAVPGPAGPRRSAPAVVPGIAPGPGGTGQGAH